MSKLHFYLHLSSKTLANYFGSAAISPSGYIDNKPHDTQSMIKNGLLISSKKYSKNDNCSLFLILTEREEKQLKTIDKDYWFFDNWLPISRVRNILFKDADQMKQTVWDINAGTAFISHDLVQHVAENEIDLANEIINIKEVYTNTDHREKLDRFDRLLGAICFSKVAKDDVHDKYINCSLSFLSFCSFFSSEIKNKYLEQGGVLNEKFNAFLGQNEKHAKLKEYIYSDLNKELIEDAFAHFGIEKVPSKYGTLDVSALETSSSVYPLAVVSVYGKSGSNKDMDLVSDIYQQKLSDKIEGICFIYGMHYGYKKLRNSYKANGKAINIKFKLSSNFDSILIESIYNYLLGGNSSIDFQKEKSDFDLSHSEDSEHIFDYQSYNIFGKNWILKKKESDSLLRKLVNILTTKVSSIFGNEFVKFDESKLNKQLLEQSKDLFEDELEKVKTPYLKKIEEQAEKIKNLQAKITVNEKDIEEVPNLKDGIQSMREPKIPLEITNDESYKKESNTKGSLKDEVQKQSLFPEPTEKKSLDSKYDILRKKNPEQRESYLKKINNKKLLNMCEELGINIHKGANKTVLVNAILEML